VEDAPHGSRGQQKYPFRFSALAAAAAAAADLGMNVVHDPLAMMVVVMVVWFCVERTFY